MDEFTSSSFFVLRTPLLPFENFLELSSSPAVDGEASSRDCDRPTSRAQLHQWTERPEVQEALWLASPDLLESITRWHGAPDSAKTRKLDLALYRYFARMTARATPFGAFAACSVGEIGDRTDLGVCSPAASHRHTRLDMEYLFNLAEAIVRDRASRKHLRFRPNDTLHLVAGRYHHLLGEWGADGRTFKLVATALMPALAATLRRAEAGATTHELVSSLVEDHPDVSLADAEEFIERLIASQVLVSDLAPPVTGLEPVAHVLKKLEHARLPRLAAALRVLDSGLRSLDVRGLGVPLASYDKIVQSAEQLPVEFQPRRLVQVDVIRPTIAAFLDRRLTQEILRAVRVLHSIGGSSEIASLQQFKDEFAERYREREVPLLEALDDEAGIGFEQGDNPTAEPLVAGISFYPTEDTSFDETSSQSSLLRLRLQELETNGKTVLELDAELINDLKKDSTLPLPDAFAVMGACFHVHGQDHGFYLQSVYGPSGANWLARFCHASPRLAELVQVHLRAEEAVYAGNAVFAEVAHLPEGRVGNVACRPVLRRYEIPFLTTPGVPCDSQLPLADLTLLLHNGRLVLRSRRLGCEVLPRLSSAHDFSSPRNLKLYKFLCLLQHQGVTPELAWNWGELQQEKFLPRVVLGDIVLSPARWTIDAAGAHQLLHGEDDQRLRRVQEWRLAAKAPRFVYIAEGDNHLLIDFEAALSLDAFLDHLRKQSSAVLVEMFPPPDALPVSGPGGRFVHEMVIPFVRNRRVEAKPEDAVGAGGPAHRSAPANPIVTPIHTAGTAAQGDWLFAKLYCSPSHADRFLTEVAPALLNELKGHAVVQRWFFTRYADPHWHLRLRFHGDHAALSAHVLPPLRRRIEEEQRRGTVWRLQFDDYEPEVDRYGGPLAIHLAEEIFHLDSELCLKLLQLLSGDFGADLRWQLALSAVDSQLTALGLKLDEKKALTANMARWREQDFVVNETYKRQVARKFRDYRQALGALLIEVEEGAGPRTGSKTDAAIIPAPALNALALYSAGVRHVREQLEEIRRAGQLTCTIPELASSLVHMHLNRIFRSCHREQEAVLCELLNRAYASRLGQARNAN
jgi:class I lanthipeptide synthase